MRGVSHVQGDGRRGAGASAMFKVMAGDEGCQPCSRRPSSPPMGGGEGRQLCSM